MGFGKYIVGGLCAVGAIVAAPVVAPAAGFALLGTAGSSVGVALMSASATTVAATAGVAAGAAGVAAGAHQEKKANNKYEQGKRDGYVEASKVYEKKIAEMEAKYNSLADRYDELKDAHKSNLSNDEEKNVIIQQMMMYIKELESEITVLRQNKEENQDEIETLQSYKRKVKYRMDKLSVA